MSEYDVKFELKDDVLHVCLSGDFPTELLGKRESLFRPLIQACSEYNSKRVLIDARNLQVKLGTLGMFRAATDAATLTQLGIRIAFVARDDMIDPFFEDVVYNHGGVVSVFTEEDAASTWLEQDQVQL